MKLNLRITLTALSVVSLASLSAGCRMPTKEGIARSTTEYNLVAEKAGNEMLLLNIVRASKRRPMYFTSFGKLTGKMTFEVGTGSVNIPFGRIGAGLNGSYSIAPSAGYEYSPLFDVGVLDTQEFTRGIMAPVPMSTIEYYWSQGWPKEMLLYLFVRRIDVIDPNHPKDPNALKDPNAPKDPYLMKTYVNYFGKRDAFDEFQDLIRTGKWDIRPVSTTSVKQMDMAEALELEDLSEVQEAGFKLTPKENNKMELRFNQVEYVFTREPDESNETAQKAEREETTPEKTLNEKDKETEKKIEDALRQGIRLVSHDSHPADMDDKLQFKYYLRSPEAILYYLGEIMRAVIEAKNKRVEDPKIRVPRIGTGHEECEVREAWLFNARKTKDQDVKSCLSVDYEGDTYFIQGDPDPYDGCCTDQSMHVLSLVSQLIGLQKKSSEAPATLTVSVLGR